MTAANPRKGSKGGFATFGLDANILKAVQEAGYEEPRPIQAKTIRQVVEGRDVLGLAQTGTGKTAAFALPILHRLREGRGKNPRALVLAPTRELAIQIHKEFETFAKYTGMRAITVFGGVNQNPQIKGLRARPEVVVACPGRLLDLMREGYAKLDGVEILVLDEADHMLDMGFLPDIKRILAKLPPRRQNLLFSATMPREIRSFADSLLQRPHTVELAHSAPAETIDHALYPVEERKKTALLRHLLGEPDFVSAIVFLRTKHRARRLARDLDAMGHRAVALQGNMSQSARQKAMDGFRKGQFDVLVATDIAARGIDVAQVSHVINYDVPNTPDAYTHRIGRTGRSERSGKACTFVTHEDFSAVKDIERKLKMSIQRIKLRDFGGEDGAKLSDRRGPAGGRGAGGRGARDGGGSRRGASEGGGSASRGGGRRSGFGRVGGRLEAPAPPPVHVSGEDPPRLKRSRRGEGAPREAFGAGIEGGGERRGGGASRASGGGGASGSGGGGRRRRGGPRRRRR
jgi:ATP-dependent RNA helicase RhlE